MAFAYPIIETLLQRHIKEWSGKLSEMRLTPEEQVELKEIFLAIPERGSIQRRFVPAYNLWVCVDQDKYFLASVTEVGV